jgi:hypothetical protein
VSNWPQCNPATTSAQAVATTYDQKEVNMKTRTSLFLTFVLMMSCLMLALPGMASSVYYSNGPLDPGGDSWTINYGYWVEDSFYLGARTRITEADFNVGESPGDTLLSVTWTITGSNGIGCKPVKMCTGTANTTNSLGQGLLTDIPLDNGWDLIKVTNLSLPILNTGTYWLSLSNATVASGSDPVYWNENAGVGCTGWNGSGQGCPSSAIANAVGTIPSESFTIDGLTVAEGNSPAAPEPSSIALFGSGLLGLAGVLRRTLMK